MRVYESPLCEVECLEQEKAFLNGASLTGYPVDSKPVFRSRSWYDMTEEDGDE